MKFTALVFALALIGCSQTPDVTTGHDVHTGERWVSAKAVMFFHDDITKAGAIPSVTIQNGRENWHITTMVARIDLNYPKIQTVHSFGKTLVYVKHDRFREFCTPKCRRVEHGEIRLTKSDFEIYAQSGLSFQMTGTRGVYQRHIPAESFTIVLQQT